MMPDDKLQRAWAKVQKKFPVIAEYGIETRMGDPSGGHGGGLEFFPPDETMNPSPGTPLIEVYEDIPEDKLEKILVLEALHYGSIIDPNYQEFRGRFERSMTPKQKEMSHRRFERFSNPRPGDPWENHPETRGFRQWFEISELDQLIGGLHTGNWPSDSYSEFQKGIMGDFMSYLRSGKEP